MRILLGGSPCQKFSIAQKNGRETQPNSGIGWELFKNYLIAKEKFKPDYFLYENNVSAAQPIKDEIKKQFGVWDGTFLMPYTDVRYIEINSALVSTQNRERFYVHNCGEVEQPKDRKLRVQDILETYAFDLTGNDKSFALTASYNGAVPWNTIERNQRNMVIEPVIFQEPHGYNSGGMKYGKTPTLTANGCWQENNKVIEPIRVGALPRPNGELSTSQALRVYSINGKATTLNHGGSGAGGKTGLYAIPVVEQEKVYGNYATEYDKDGKPIKAYCYADGKIHTVYEVIDGKITIKGKEYPIKLPDGFYIIRKLTVTECRRLQQIPDWYVMPCSATQNYKMLGNGWSIEVIKHILSHIPNITKEPIEVLSMYDGMSGGQIALKELGATVVSYKAYEIDKYAIQTTQANFPNTIQCGDAFQVRQADWKY